MNKTPTLNIRTPEGVVFSQQLAGPMTRFLAWSIDLSLLIGFMILLNILLAFLSWVSAEIAQALGLLMYFAFSIGYGIFTEWRWRGQTLGKRLLHLRVVDVHGLRLKIGQVVIRNLLRPVDMLPGPYLVGGLACVLSNRCQRLGDLAANTVVVRIPNGIEPNLDQLASDKYNSMRAHPHLEARLRQRVSPIEASTALQAIIRRDLLEPRARVELFEGLANHFKEKVRFPGEVADGITDEQYVRNVVDCLFRPGRKPPGSTREALDKTRLESFPAEIGTPAPGKTYESS
ncbi:MAG: hypothetical protein QOF48_681 [Verrucomicrobiota bacterium]|jgi:uncharacterized RDD family membrane protein YckC